MTSTNSINDTQSNNRSLFAQLLEQQEITVVPETNTVITGTVIGFCKEGAWVSYGGKFDGIVPAAELATADLKIDQRCEFLVVSEQDDNGHVYLSFTAAKAWSDAQSALNTGETVQVKVIGVIRRRETQHVNGVRVAFGSLRGFVPRSKLLAHSSQLNELVGTEIAVKVIEVSVPDRKLVFDHSAIALSAQAAQREELMASLTPGATVKGTIARLAVKEGQEFGFFVDLGAGLSGLLHRTEIAGSFQKPLTEVLELGSEVELKVLSVQTVADKLRIALSHRAAVRETVLKSLSVDAPLKVKVVRIVDFGCFVQVAPGVDALLHKNCFSPAMRGEQAPAVGDVLDVFVESVDHQYGRIGVTANAPRRA